MIRIQISEVHEHSLTNGDGDATGVATFAPIERYSRTVDSLDIEAVVAAISAVITKQAPARKRRSDAGKTRKAAQP